MISKNRLPPAWLLERASIANDARWLSEASACASRLNRAMLCAQAGNRTHSWPGKRVTRTNRTASKKVDLRVDSLDARTSFVGPFELDTIVAKHAGFPCTDVTDFAMVVVVPALPGNGISDRLAQFVRDR